MEIILEGNVEDVGGSVKCEMKNNLVLCACN